MAKRSADMQNRWPMGLLFLVLGATQISGFISPSSFRPTRSLEAISGSRGRSPFLLNARRDPEEGDDDDEIDVSDQDWRDFRAKLVMQEPTMDTAEKVVQDEGDLDGIGSVFQSTPEEAEKVSSSSPNMTPLDPAQWAYDSGNVIEKGAVILGGVEQEYGFGLRQQYFHKAAILVLDHEESTFTKGIILNRPSDLTLDDDLNEGVKWKVWFGGDVQGIGSNNPEIVCLHSLKNKQVTEASIPVMKDIQVSHGRQKFLLLFKN